MSRKQSIAPAVGNFTWPVVVSLVGLLVPLIVSYVQQVGDRSTLRQLERVSAMDLDEPEVGRWPDRSGRITVDRRIVGSPKRRSVREARIDLQIALISEIRSKVDSDRKRRAFTQSLVYFVFVALGTVGSGWSVGYVTGSPDYSAQPVLWVIAFGLLILNLAALLLAGTFVAKSGAALFPQFDRELIRKKKPKTQNSSGVVVAPSR